MSYLWRLLSYNLKWSQVLAGIKKQRNISNQKKKNVNQTDYVSKVIEDGEVCGYLTLKSIQIPYLYKIVHTNKPQW